MTCVGCGETKGEAPGHSFEDGACTKCSAHLLGYGKWEAMRLNDTGSLSVLTVSFNNPNGSGGFSSSTYVDTATLSPDQLAEMQGYGARVIAFEGKEYIAQGGAGDPCHFTIDGNVANIGLGEVGDDWPEKMTLELTGTNEATVTFVSDAGFYGLAVGAVFTYAG
jgi:hypothetical protein